MGYQETATTITLTAKLTPLGRKLLVTNTNNLITKFSLGDSDANYNVSDLLTTGQVPSMGGDNGLNGTSTNSTGNDSFIKYPLLLNGLGGNLKSVDPASINVTSVLQNVGQVTNITGSSLSINYINRADSSTDSLVNLFATFNLPLSENDKTTYTATTFSRGGWSDTALSGLGTDEILVIGIDNSKYGETLDGKEIKIDLTTSATSYTIYSTFQSKGTSLSAEDVNYKDTSTTTTKLGNPISFLVSDDIMKPNGGDVTLSWGTGFGLNKPFSINGKRLYNLRTDSNVSKTADTVVGVAYLEKGLLVITDPTIISEYDSGTTSANITANSVSTNVTQNITCIAGRGEFGTSSNPSWRTGDVVRITELGLYDNQNRLIAYGKFDRQVSKTIDSFASFGIKISL